MGTPFTDDDRPGVETLAEPRAEDSPQVHFGDEFQPWQDAPQPGDMERGGGLALTLALGFVFLRFSYFHEMLTSTLGLDFRLVLIVGLPALLAAIFNRALQRTFQWRVAQYWALFVLWMVLAIPFSHWISGSLDVAITYLRTTFLVVFLVGGLTISTRDCYRMMSTIGVAGLFSILSAKLFAAADQPRLGLAYGGSIANSNDYAAHLLMILPFVVWMGLSTRNKLVRIIWLATSLYGFFAVVRTGSRGALLAIVAVALFLIFRAPGGRRMLYIAVLTVFAIAVILLTPQNLRDRYMTIFVDNSDVAQTGDAVGSSESRRYLLTTALGLALTHPLFGVGQNQFDIAEAAVARSEGRRAEWHSPHNSYLQVASELGIPAFVFYIAALLTTFRMLSRCYLRCNERQDLRRLGTGAFCLMASLIGFGVAIFFINVPYTVYLPTLSGLAIALTRATERELYVSPEPPNIDSFASSVALDN